MNTQEQLNQALFEAAEAGRVDDIRSLIAQGADIEANNGHALWIAACRGQIESVRLLVSLGCRS